MENLKSFAINLLKKIISQKSLRKYLITTVIFILLILFFDDSSVYKRQKYVKELERLELDKRFYIEKIRSDSIQLSKLKNNVDQLEKYAREKYFMKKKGEDIFVIIEE